MRTHGKDEVFRITGARRGLDEDVRGRQRRYVISMTVRTISVILAAVLWNVERHVAFVALALGLLLPYIAVVIANAGRESAPTLPSTFVMAPSRPMLEERTADEPAGEPAGNAADAPADQPSDSPDEKLKKSSDQS
ncbi:DUF3099 domain-containing protein [Streptomyces sp. NPDC048629]|uniref:DUF3099 domain-containing protein n=1 Tax=Streptomyces sp. NPDC048629 TaxID=3154824 RepID=UPI0034229095